MLVVRALLPVALLLGGCSTRVLPAPATPTREVPIAMPSETTAAGTGRVIVDVVGEHASVEWVKSRTDAMAYGPGVITLRSDVAADPLCTTPCVVDLPLGSHELRFAGSGVRRTDTDFVVASPHPTVFRYAPGESHPRKGARILGATAIGIGAPLTLVGGIAIAAQKDTATPEQRNGAIAFTAASAGLLALGILTLVLFPPEYQPASSVQWEVER